MSEPYPLEELARLPTFYHPTVSPDGERIACYYDGTGRNELHVLEGGDLERLSDGEVPRTATWDLFWGPDGETVYFHRDEAGDEQNDLYAMDPDGGVEAVVEMDGQCILEDATRDGLLFTSDAGEQMNLYRHDAGTGENEQLTSYDQPVVTALASPDGERIAYATNESDDLENQDVYVADADGSDPRTLDIGEEGFEAGVTAWHPDGDALLVSDDSTDLPRAGVYDLETDGITWYGPNEHEESPAAFLPGGDGIVVTRTREAATVPVVYRDGAGRELDLPEGVASIRARGSGDPFLDGSTLALSHTASDRRKELIAYDLAADETEVLIAAEYGDIDPDAFVAAEYVTYGSHDDTEIGALLYDSGERPSAGVVQVHGGPHGQSRKRFNPYTQFLVSRGYTVLQPNYRGSTGRGREFKTAIHGDWGGAEAGDIHEAGEWLKAREWIDADRVAVFGGSYGGYSTYMQLVSYPEAWATGVAWVGITDLHAMYEESMPHFRTFLEEQMGDPEENHELWRERSPIEHVDDLERPLLIVHGVNDPRCPIGQARLFRDALEERGWEEGEDGDFEYVELGEEGHGSTDQDQKVRAFRIIDGYLDRRL